MNNNQNKLDMQALETWLWDAVCKLHRRIDAPKYKDLILPLIFLKRLSNVYDDEVEKFAKYLNRSLEEAEETIANDHRKLEYA